MKNFIQQGDLLSIKAPYKVYSGDLVVIDNLVGVAALSMEKGEQVTIATEGVFELLKAETEALKIGARVRYAEKGLVTGGEKGSVVGIVIEDAQQGTTTVRVKLCC